MLLPRSKDPDTAHALDVRTLVPGAVLMDEWDDPIEEAGGVELIDESASTSDAGWKDELNLAEFPIAALTDRVPDGQTTLVFEDKLERRDSPPIVRRLTIMGTH